MISTNLRKLRWTPQGYHPEGYDWWNYRVANDIKLLRHDLFEHQINETGERWEELRALGATERFTSNIKKSSVSYYTIWKPFVQAATDEFAVKSISVKRIKCIEKFVTLMELDNPEWCIKILMDGYEYAKQWNVIAYEKFITQEKKLNTWFENGLDVFVNLDTGKFETHLSVKSETFLSIEKGRQAASEHQGMRTTVERIEQQRYVSNIL